MRFTEEQSQAVHEVLKKFLSNGSYELYLYGSRTQDHLKGGDIDLLVITNEKNVSIFNDNKLMILVEIKKHKSIGQRRIDINAHTSIDLDTLPFLLSIKPTLVRV